PSPSPGTAACTPARSSSWSPRACGKQHERRRRARHAGWRRPAVHLGRCPARLAVATFEAVDVHGWLLDSDPALRWQVLRDLLGAPPDEVAAERARVATEGWGARLLALQGADG